MEDSSWEEFFLKICNAFCSQNILIDEERECLYFTLWCFVEGRQITFRYKLLEVMNSPQRISDLMFDLLQLANDGLAAQEYISRLRSTIKKQASFYFSSITC